MHFFQDTFLLFYQILQNLNNYTAKLELQHYSVIYCLPFYGINWSSANVVDSESSSSWDWLDGQPNASAGADPGYVKRRGPRSKGGGGPGGWYNPKIAQK